MELKTYTETKSKHNIFDDDEARSAINFALDLLEAEKLHIETKEPSAYYTISRLEAAHSELSSLSSDLEDFMD